MSAAISFKYVSKHYRGVHGYRALRDDVMGAVRRLIERPPKPIVTALDDVSFEIPEGQSFALIGENGAGKTTCLKLACRITYPSAGSVRVQGRVGALIEVGTGLHHELTGRENVSLYGRILGLSSRDVQRRFADIVEFAGIGAAIDQPVKQYSSGMQLRLGFSVAAHLEPDILLVDEAIAVGDAGFQYRCVERMAELVKEGRTLVFVSHELTAIEALCERAILLREGRVVEDGPARAVVHEYLRGVQAKLLASETTTIAGDTDTLEILGVSLHGARGEERNEFRAGEPMTVRIRYRAPQPLQGPIFTLGLCEPRFGCFAEASMLMDGRAPAALIGEGSLECTFAELPLLPRAYEVWGEVRGASGFGAIVDWQRLRLFRVTDESDSSDKRAVTSAFTLAAPVKIPYRWQGVDG